LPARLTLLGFDSLRCLGRLGERSINAYTVSFADSYALFGVRMENPEPEPEFAHLVHCLLLDPHARLLDDVQRRPQRQRDILRFIIVRKLICSIEMLSSTREMNQVREQIRLLA
jgi:hypothetical protein